MIMKNGLTKKLKRLLAGLLAAGTALIFCACELPGTEINYGDKDNSAYHAHIVKPQEVTVDVPEEKPDPGYKETYESFMMNFVVPNDFDKMEYFSREEFYKKNPEVKYSDDELLKASEAYFSHMQELVDMGWEVKFNFIYFNNDNLAELVYASYSGDIYEALSVEFHICTYDFETGEVIEIGTYYSQYGMSLYYVEKENLMWYTEWKDDESFLYNYYVTINQDNKFELVASFERDVSTMDPDSLARVNHIDTDYDTLMDYLGCFDYLVSDSRRELDTYSLNTMIPYEGSYVFDVSDNIYDNYYKEYDDDCLKAVCEAYVEELEYKAEDASYLFAFVDGDNLPEMFLLLNNRVCLYKASVYKDETWGISRYVYEVSNSELKGDLSFAEYHGVIREWSGNVKVEDVRYKIYNNYECFLMQKFVRSTDKDVFSLNGMPISRKKFEDFYGRWSEFTFTDLNITDFYQNKSEKNIEKAYYDALKNYNP